MKRVGTMFIGAVCVAALTAHAVVNDTIPASSGSGGQPYSAIWLRNIFDLKPPPPPAVEAPKPAAPPPNVQLTGISTLGETKAMFMVKEQPLPGKPANKEEPYMLRVHQREGQLEVLEIDPQAKTVKIDLAGVISTITFETNRSSGGGGMAAGGPGNVPQPPPGFQPGPGPGFGNGTIPARNVRSDSGNAGFSPSQNGYPQVQNGIGYGGGGNLPYNQTAQTAQNSEPQPSFEEQMAKYQINKAIMAPQIQAGLVPPLPSIPGVDDAPQPNASENSSGTSSSTSSYPNVPGRRSTGTLR